METKTKPINYICTVKSFRMLTPTVFETCFETDADIKFIAGQFVSIIIPGAGPNGRDLRRAYSIASGPKVRPIELCIKLVEGGPGTEYLYKLRAGDSFKGIAPYGDFVFKPKEGKNACFISTGTGIAPFRSMVESDHFKEFAPKRTLCLFGVRQAEELLYVDEFKKNSRVEFVATVSQPDPTWHGFKGRVTDYLRQLPPDFDWKHTEYYLCGNGSMITEVKQILADKGIGKESIHQEVYYK